MGVDLQLLPRGRYNESYTCTVISLDRDRNLFDKIQQLPTKPVGIHISHPYSGVGETNKDLYGDDLYMVQAKHLKTLELLGPADAYVKATPDDHWFILFWH